MIPLEEFPTMAAKTALRAPWRRRLLHLRVCHHVVIHNRGHPRPAQRPDLLPKPLALAHTVTEVRRDPEPERLLVIETGHAISLPAGRRPP